MQVVLIEGNTMKKNRPFQFLSSILSFKLFLVYNSCIKCTFLELIPTIVGKRSSNTLKGLPASFSQFFSQKWDRCGNILRQKELNVLNSLIIEIFKNRCTIEKQVFILIYYLIQQIEHQQIHVYTLCFVLNNLPKV